MLAVGCPSDVWAQMGVFVSVDAGSRDQLSQGPGVQAQLLPCSLFALFKRDLHRTHQSTKKKITVFL